jgi:hypothetical protein
MSLVMALIMVTAKYLQTLSTSQLIIKQSIIQNH